MWGEKKHKTWESATSGEQIVRLFWNDVKAKHWNKVEAHIGAQFIGTGPTGKIDRAAVLDHLRQMDLTAFQIGEVETRSAGKDMIVSYTMALNGTIGGRPLPSTPVRMLSVWQPLSKGWVMVAHATVPAAQ